MMKRNLLTGVAVVVMALSACNDETLDIGRSLTGETDKLYVNNADFKVTTKSVLADSVLLRSSYCYLGRAKDPETKSCVTSEFMTQFNILETFSLPKQDDIVTRHEGVVAADSCQLELYYNPAKSTVDSLSAMKIRVSELAMPMEEGRRYYSNYDPIAEGLIRENGMKKDKVFTLTDLTVSESQRKDSEYLSSITIKLNEPYTDKSGTTYNNYGTYVMRQYFQHPEYFKNSYAFIHNVCPGFFFSVVDGEGAYVEIMEMSLRFFFQQKTSKADSTSTYASALAGTEEILQTTKITNDKDRLLQLTADNTCTYVKAPAGVYTEVTLPIDDIYKGHENDSILIASISFQRINNLSEEKTYSQPGYLMMLPTDSLNSFFESQKLPDNKLTFSSSFSVKTNQYDYSNISSLINRMVEMKHKGLESDNNWVAKHPNWNKVLLVPVQAISTSASGVTSISSYEHCVGLAAAKLVGGSENPNQPIMLKVVYGNFKR